MRAMSGDAVPTSYRTHSGTPREGVSGPARLLIVDDHVVCCAGMAVLFRNMQGICAVVVANEAEEAVGLARQFRPDVVLMDTTLPKYGAFWAARRILECCSGARVVFLDDQVHASHVRETLRAGGFGYWTKHATFAQIAEAVRRAAAGQTSFCPEVHEKLISTSSGPQFRPSSRSELAARLTTRELEVLTYVAQGLSVKECAERMRLARSTVDNHKTRLMRKLDLHKAADLVRFAIREGLVAG